MFDAVATATTPLSQAEDLLRSGLFAQALETTRSAGATGASQVLRVWALERTGATLEAKELAERLLKRRDLSSLDRATCEYVLGQIAWECVGDTNAALSHIQRAISLSDSCGNDWNSCMFRLRLLVMMTDKSGPLSVVPLFAKLRAQCTKLGDPSLSACLHIFIAETETKRGLLRSGERHARLGKSLLSLKANPWLGSIADTALVANGMTRGGDVLAYAQHALEQAEEAGSATMRRACLCNMGVVLHTIGRFEEAVTYIERALQVLPSAGERANGCYESLARIRMTQEKHDEADYLLKKIESSISLEEDWLLSSNRHARLTRGYWYLHQRRFNEALDLAETSAVLAGKAGDHVLTSACKILRTKILAIRGTDVTPLLDAIARELPHCPYEFHVSYECIVGLALAKSGDSERSESHFARADRLCEATGNLALHKDVQRLRTLFVSYRGETRQSASAPQRGEPHRMFSTAIHNLSSLFLRVGQPELVASEAIGVLRDSQSVTKVAAWLRNEGDTIRVLSTWGDTSPDLGAFTKVVEVGSRDGMSVVVGFTPKNDPESEAVAQSVILLVESARQLDRANAEREERLTLWPQEEETIDEGDGVILGQMRELMTFAKRVAKTNISVLITGESGTGKEILARAVHKYSTRADKPFMPFNCTAVPRDMLESQLFGHRRGAFTSADRDNPGLIRAAKAGTLFLDEIGELGLDLQPKLLRFLESGEISPLGETGPVNVDVRIIAATNRDLEELVRAERFREDLFYRLNVIRLTIPPLRERRDEIPALINYFVARSAHDLGKGQLRVAEETMERFLLYQWPGNIRQLQNEIRRIVALADVDGVLTPDMLTHEIRKAGPRVSHRRDGQELVVPLHDKLGPTLAHVEREVIRAALKNSRGRLEPAAKALGISRKGLYLKRQRLGL